MDEKYKGKPISVKFLIGFSSLLLFLSIGFQNCSSNSGSNTTAGSNAGGDGDGIGAQSSDLLIIQHPGPSRSINTGTSITFTVVATSSRQITYTWYRNGNPLGGTNSPALQLSNVTSTHQGEYFVSLDDGVKQLQSNSFTLTVNTLGAGANYPPFVEEPAEVSIASNTWGQLRTTVQGAQPLYFVWHRNGSAISETNYLYRYGVGTDGGWTSILSIYAANNTIVGNYFARAYFSDGSSKDSATVSVSIASYVGIALGDGNVARILHDEEGKSLQNAEAYCLFKTGNYQVVGWELSGLITVEYTAFSGGENTSAAHGFKIFHGALSLAKYFESITCVGD